MTQTYGIWEENQADHNEITSNFVCNNTVADIAIVGPSTTTAGNSDCGFAAGMLK